MSVAIRLCVSGSAFILLWCSAMNLLTATDALLFFIIIWFGCLGAYYGGWRSLFYLFSFLISLNTAIFSYNILYIGLDLNYSLPILWGQILCFVLTALATWILFYLLIKTILPKWLQKRDQNITFGGICGLLQGIFWVYLLLLILLVSDVLHVHPWIDKDSKNSYTIQFIGNYTIGIDKFQSMELLLAWQNINHRYEILWVSQAISDGKPSSQNNESLQNKIYDFLLWLEQNPHVRERWYQHAEMQRTFDKLLHIPDVKKYWQSEPILQQLKQQKTIHPNQICELLKQTSSLELLKSQAVSSLLLQINFDKVKSGN